MTRRAERWMAATLLIAAPGAAAGQSTLEWAGARWRAEAAEARVERFEGRGDALLLTNGAVWMEGPGDGTVEFELHAGREMGFYGLAFRAKDAAHYEHVYVRPFMSGNPDATQYTPVLNGVSGWQIYASPRFAGPLDIPTDRWVRVRIAFTGRRAELTVDDRTVVFPELLGTPGPGDVGLTSSGAPAHFANVRVSGEASRLDGGAGAPRPEVPPGVVSTWRVSSPFPEARVEGTDDRPPGAWADLAWTMLHAGVAGIANLAEAHPRSTERNTVMAAVTLKASRSGPVRLRFGFSDRVVVFLDGRPLYRGAAEWRSRDYRFLGTVGLFDELILPLSAGDNHLWLAVSEDFGGWGVIAQLLDAEGVEVVPDLDG